MMMARAPILPRDPRDPTGADRLERGAMRDFDVRMRLIRKGYLRALNSIQAEPVVNRKYTFRLDQALLSAIFRNVDLLVDEILMQGGERGLWFFESYVSVAYQRGTAQEFANLGQQSPVYKAGRESLENLLRSEPYQTRLSLIRARQFEEMKGLSGNVRANMSRILTDGMGRGLNPREIARNLTEQIGIEKRRAYRIARTEIGTALRRARMDEADSAEAAYGMKSMQMHSSALSPTTRLSHANRHAKLFTTAQQRDWWSVDGNSVNCKCSTIAILVDENGKPLVPYIVERARENYAVMKKAGDGPWANDEE